MILQGAGVGLTIVQSVKPSQVLFVGKGPNGEVSDFDLDGNCEKDADDKIVIRLDRNLSAFDTVIIDLSLGLGAHDGTYTLLPDPLGVPMADLLPVGDRNGDGLVSLSDFEIGTVDIGPQDVGVYRVANAAQGIFLFETQDSIEEGSRFALHWATGLRTTGYRVVRITSGSIVTIADMTIRHGDEDTGGGVLNEGQLALERAAVVANFGTTGGGIVNTGMLTLTDTTVDGNTAISAGGGIYNSRGASLIVTDSTVSGNDAQSDGGGIFNDGEATLTNTTISGNMSAAAGGGVHTSSLLRLINVTVTKNDAQTGSGISNENEGLVELVNTILAGNVGSDCEGNITSQGHNLVGSSPDCGLSAAEGDLLDSDPELRLLEDNGGPAETHAVLSDSPAFDAGDDGSAPATDQRGVVRPWGEASDIGAFEFAPTRIRGTARLQGRSDTEGIVFSVYRDVPRGIHGVDETGRFSTDLLATGLSTVRAWHIEDQSFLPAETIIDVKGGEEIELQVELLSGDINIDGVIDARDLAIIGNNVDSFVERPVRDGPWSARVSGREAPRAVGC